MTHDGKRGGTSRRITGWRLMAFLLLTSWLAPVAAETPMRIVVSVPGPRNISYLPIDLIGKIGLIKAGPHRRPMTGHQALRWRATKDHAADRVNRDDPGRQFLLPRVLSASPQGAAGTGSAEHQVNFPFQCREDLAHRLMVREGVIDVGVLVRPEAISG